METLRTPEDRFGQLTDFPFEPRYTEVDAGDGTPLRVHYVDEGPRDGETILCLHGEPSWSYLYRKMIPVFVDAGYRVVAPDLPGFGRSDKPADRNDYTYASHMRWMTELVCERMNLTGINLVCQDWGGLLGLRLAAEQESRFARIAAANTFLPTGDQTPTDAFFQWREFSQKVPELPVSRIVQSGCTSELGEDVLAAYDAPFPAEEYKEGARQFPVLVPATPKDPATTDNRKAWEVLERWQKPFLTAFSDCDPVTAGSERPLRSRIPGAHGVDHTTITGAGHFLQEDAGPEFARVVVDFIAAT